MFRRLFILEWKAFFRSANVGRGIAVKLLLGFMVLYFVMMFLLLGLGLHDILRKAFPDEAPIHVVNRFLLLWVLGDFVIRFMFQSLPVMNIRPMLVQNIRRHTIVHYLLTKSVLSPFNLLTPIVFIPFILISMTATDFSTVQLLGWLIGLLALVLTMNFLNILIQKKFSENIKAIILLVAVCLLLGALDYYGVFSISALFGHFFDTLLVHSYLAFVPIALLMVTYVAGFRHLKDNLYLDTVSNHKSSSYKETNLAWTDRFGAMSPFLQLDIRLLWRNKRPRSTVLLSFFFLLYGLFFYSKSMDAGSSTLIFVGIFITGIFIINFGQFIPAWDSSYYSMLMAQNIPLKLYLDSKAMLMYISIVILTLLSTPYIYFGWHVFLVNIACAVYNMGVNVPVLLYFGSYNKKRIDMDKTPFFNYQGTGAAQWIVSIPLFLAPIILWAIISRLADTTTATIALAVLGGIGILLKNIVMAKIVKAYQQRKYTMIDGFKQQN